MKEFKVGGKVVLGENESYLIVDIVNYEGETYYFASSIQKPIIPKIFQKIEEDGKIYVKFIDDIKIVKAITNKVVKE